MLDMFIGARKTQFATSRLELSSRHYDEPDAGAIKMSNRREFEDDLIFVLVPQGLRGRFQLLALFADGDPSRDFQHDNVRQQVLGLNLQHEAIPFAILWFLISAEATEQDNIGVIVTSAPVCKRHPYLR